MTDYNLEKATTEHNSDNDLLIAQEATKQATIAAESKQFVLKAILIGALWVITGATFVVAVVVQPTFVGALWYAFVGLPVVGTWYIAKEM